jgi:hypothetical protein
MRLTPMETVNWSLTADDADGADKSKELEVRRI